MAKFEEYGADNIYDMGKRLLSDCLQGDKTLFEDGADIWTPDNLEDLRRRFRVVEEKSDKNFEQKLKTQLTGAAPKIYRLAAEILAVYFLFPSNVTAGHKKKVIKTVLEWQGWEYPSGSALDVALNEHIGSGGMGYNTRRPNEFGFMLDFAIAWKKIDPNLRVDVLGDAPKFQQIVDTSSTTDDASRRQLRHMLLHILFPDDYERVASGDHKRRIVAAFGSVATQQGNADIDAQLRDIRRQLQQAMPKEELDFYWSPLAEVWYTSDSDDEGGLSMDALRHKKQVVLYGPPGTGKTHRAKEIATRVISAALLKASANVKAYFENLSNPNWARTEIAGRIHRLQLHPAYSYEDFVRGLHIGPGGVTVYRPGYLLRLIDKINKDDSKIPHVLILDEINRTDLSRTLGECFSMLEDRGAEVDLPGIDDAHGQMSLRIPENLYIIGTMNLIDQSIEQMDFALRRRFLWVLCPFDEGALLTAARFRWEEACKVHQPPCPVPWAEVEKDFRVLAQRAAVLNGRIRENERLGEQYEIGHTYLLDVVAFLLEHIGARPARAYLWNRDNAASNASADTRAPDDDGALRVSGARWPVEQLWALSLRPLIEEYLSGLDAKTRDSDLKALKASFLDAS